MILEMFVYSIPNVALIRIYIIYILYIYMFARKVYDVFTTIYSFMGFVLGLCHEMNTITKWLAQKYQLNCFHTYSATYRYLYFYALFTIFT